MDRPNDAASRNRSEPLAIRRLTPEGSAVGERILIAETPVAISFFGIGYAVMMATPCDLEDFAVGFARSERLIDAADEVIEIDIRPADNGLLLQVELAEAKRALVFDRVRHRIGETSCGLCGIENLEQALRPLPRSPRPPAVSKASLFRALGEIRPLQPLNEMTGAAHAAALVSHDGRIEAVREDVGRHNAFDKLIGLSMREKRDLSGAFALLTSRCSYELVEKAVLAGFGLMVTVSAPTNLAAHRAMEAGLTLVALARPDAMLIVSDPHRLFG